MKDDLDILLTMVRSCFSVSGDAEIAMEADPRQMTEEKAEPCLKGLDLNQVAY